MTRADELRAELALAEAEDKYVKAKTAAKPDANKVRDLKIKLRDLRATSRQARDGGTD